MSNDTPWLWPPMEQKVAEAAMNTGGLTNGKFLIRERKAGSDKLYALCLVHKGKITHHRIDKTDGGKYTVNQKAMFGQYDSLVHLVTTLSGGEGCPPKWPTKLAEACVNPEPMSAPASTPAAPAVEQEDVSHLKYVHGVLAREQVTELLSGKEDGMFLVRRGPSGQAELLSVVYKQKATHHKIGRNDKNMYTINRNDFGLNASTLEELITALQTKSVDKWPVKLSATPVEVGGGGGGGGAAAPAKPKEEEAPKVAVAEEPTAPPAEADTKGAEDAEAKAKADKEAAAASKAKADADAKAKADQASDTNGDAAAAAAAAATAEAKKTAAAKKSRLKKMGSTMRAMGGIEQELADLVAEEEAKDAAVPVQLLANESAEIASGITSAQSALKALQEQQEETKRQMESRRQMAMQLQAQQQEYQRQVEMFRQMQAQNQVPQNLAGTTPLGLKGAGPGHARSPGPGQARQSPGGLVSSQPQQHARKHTARRQRPPKPVSGFSTLGRKAFGGSPAQRPGSPRKNSLVLDVANSGAPGTDKKSKQRKKKRSKKRRGEKYGRDQTTPDESDAATTPRMSAFQRIRAKIRSNTQKEQVKGSDAIAKLHTKVVILSSDGMFVSDAGFLVKDGRYAHETDI